MATPADRARLLVPALALAAGTAIACVDSRATWDDAGVTAGAVLLAAAVLAAARPRLAPLVGVAVGLPVVAFNVVLHANYGSVLALAFGLAGAGLGHVVGRALGFGPARAG